MIRHGVILLVGLVAAATSAYAAAPASSGPRNARLSWTAPATYTDGRPIAETLTYRAYRRADGSQQRVLVWEGSGTEVLLTAQPLGRQCYVVTAVGAGGESAPSAEACKLIRLDTPGNARFEQPPMEN